MRRPLETMILGYPDLKKRLESKGKPVVLLDTLQEVAEYVAGHVLRDQRITFTLASPNSTLYT
jgi:hypothetical protein